MSGWTIHSTHGQLDPRECIRFNPCQERQSASWVPFHPTHELFCSCSLQYSEPSLASVLYSLLRVFFFFFFFFTIYPFWVFWVLHFLCYGFCLFPGSFFSGWTPCTNQKPRLLSWWRIRKDRKQEKKRGAQSCQSWKAPFPQKARSALPGPAPRRALPTSDLWAVKFQQGLGRGVASQRSDLATAGERRGTLVLGVSLILRWSPQCQKLWLKKKLKSGLTLKWVNFFFQLTNYTFHSNPKHVKIMVNLQQNHGESSAKVHSSWYDGQADWDIVYLRNLSISLWAFKYLGINTRVEPGCCTGLHKLLCKHSHTYSHTHTYSDTRNTHTPSPHRGTFCKLYIWFQRTNR